MANRLPSMTWLVATASPVLLLLVLVGVEAAADEIHLRGGGRVVGEIVEKSSESVTIETGPGLLTLPTAAIEKIVDGRSPLEVWGERANSLSASDAEGWAALARWAADRDLGTQSRQAWEHVLRIDPGHLEANAALDRVRMGDRFMNRVDAYRAQGLVPFEGDWVSPSELDNLLQQRAAEEAASYGERQAELRLREAEARAREAEARATAAEMAAQTPPDAYGIPLGWVYGGEPFAPDGFVEPVAPPVPPPATDAEPAFPVRGLGPASPSPRTPRRTLLVGPPSGTSGPSAPAVTTRPEPRAGSAGSSIR